MGWFTPWRWVFTSWRLVPNVDFKPNKTSTLWSFTTFSLPDLQRWGPPYNYKRSIWFHPRPYKWRNIIHETTGVVVTLWSFLWLYIYQIHWYNWENRLPAHLGWPKNQKPTPKPKPKPAFFPERQSRWKLEASSQLEKASSREGRCLLCTLMGIASHRFASFRTRGRETRWSNVFGFYFFFGGGLMGAKKK